MIVEQFWKTVPPLIAILRGIQPSECVLIGEALYQAGFRLIEVPLNSPDALVSIKKLSVYFGDRALIGAGTVLNTGQVDQVELAGGQFIVSPNFNVAVVQSTKKKQLLSFPGVMTVSEVFAAYEAGADGLKLFPVEALTPQVLKALRTVIPSSVPIFPVGGISVENMLVWYQAGASGFGLGSALYKAGDVAEQVSVRAKALISTWQAFR